MLIAITHQTTYDYADPVSYGLQKVRLRPLSDPQQSVRHWLVEIEGGRVEVSYPDHFGNHTQLVSTFPGARQIIVRASGLVETTDAAGVLGHVFGAAPLWHFLQPTSLTTPGSQVRSLARQIDAAGNDLDRLHKLSANILKKCPYAVGTTGPNTTAEEAISLGSGVCQDHTHIFIAAARAAGFPARYVSGYLMMNETIDQDASHAWAEVYTPSIGWVGFDVSNGYSPDSRYVRIATGKDARDAAPVTGMRMGTGDESLIVSLQVQQ